MIDVARIDHWAATPPRRGLFHRASVFSKILFLGLVVTAAVISKNPSPLAAGYALLLITAAASRLPWSSVALFSLYPAVFAVLYGLSLRGGAWMYGLLLFKAVTPAFAMVMLIVSTPYPKIFSLMSTFLPEIISSGLFMTYRTLFILLDMMNSFAAAIRLRGGFSPGSLAKNSSNISKGLAMLLIRAVERATRLYAVMAVRGYNGSMAEARIGRLSRHDWLPIGAGTAVLMLVVLWK